MRVLICEHLHQPEASPEASPDAPTANLAAGGGLWRSPGVLHIDEAGVIRKVSDQPPEPGPKIRIEHLNGVVLPGIPNLHSHAFQRALSGLTENTVPGQQDSFWTWRTRMYRLALSLSPDDMQSIAEQLYVEMLEAGMTSVGEFHYLHHDADGGRYSAPGQMSLRILAAARTAKIALTHLPVLYCHGGFNRPFGEEQRRFVHHGPDDFLKLVSELRPHIKAEPTFRLGIAPHSLRAVDKETLTAAVDGLHSMDEAARIHIHIAEQTKEVEDCLAHLGQRPVEWLLGQCEIDHRWCLVHATHMNDAETDRLASSGAVAGLCPTTEANLGDGFFPAPRYAKAGGVFGVGSDSHATISAAEELRTLEYGQRLLHQRRNLLVGEGQKPQSVGRFLFDRAVLGGARALGQPVGQLLEGQRADLIRLDPEHPRLLGHGPDTALDAWIFGAAERAVKDVMVAGEWVVREGVHSARSQVKARFRKVMHRLASL